MATEGDLGAGTAAAAPASGDGTATVRHRPEFRGDAREYFRIWIVNLALTILTLGIYSAWAKVRKLRYFYSNTVLAGSAFGYHGDPRKILKGRIIAVLLTGSYVAAGRISPIASLIVVGLLALATPWLVVKSRIFALRVTSWRGLRFNFRDDYRGAYRILLGGLILGMVTLGILMPWFIRERYRFIVTRSLFGATAFECNPRVGRFYGTACGAAGLALGIGICAGLLFAFIGRWIALTVGLGPAAARMVPALSVTLTYFIIFPVVLGYTQARNLNEVFGHTSLGPHRLVSNLSALRLTGIYLTNLIGVVLTLGLFIPWAQIRLARYRLAAMEVEAQGSLEDFVAGAAAPVPSATGEEISSLLDVDFGF